jgi:hypothetical protein
MVGSRQSNPGRLDLVPLQEVVPSAFALGCAGGCGCAEARTTISPYPPFPCLNCLERRLRAQSGLGKQGHVCPCLGVHLVRVAGMESLVSVRVWLLRGHRFSRLDTYVAC